jgi:cellular nucleic acid-binding protein
LQTGLENNITVGDGEMHCGKSSRKHGRYSKGKKCFNCGNVGHTPAACRKPRGNKSCYSCGKEGHVAKYCPNKRE